MPKQVFLSYSTNDTPTATAVRDHLEAELISCWMAPRDIVPGNDYGEQIITAIEQASILLLILSESSNHSTFVRHEVERAVAKGKVIMPFRIQPVQPSRSLEFFISNYQWIDGWEAPLTRSSSILVASIRSHLQGKPPQPATPLSMHAVNPTPSNNLPHQLTPFVGRERELAALDDLMNQPEVRLIIILGPGGMGKTRLSLAVAERHLTDPRFVHGVYFVPLASLSEVQHIVPTLIDVLSLSSQINSGTPQQHLLDYLSTKAMLLVFDNFEHLLDGATLLAHILQAAPQVKVLVTSRERLRLQGEHLFPLQGLDYDRSIDSADPSGAAAVQLFVQSARQIQPDLVFREVEMAQIANICRLVGGMPLGIELAAAWTEVLPPAEIAAEIERSLDFLEAERRGGQEHHRSVRAVFDSTWQRLDPTEQAVFARLSIFRGGFTREAAEQVAEASLRLLSNLVGKSLIQHSREQGRYTLHELLRQFAEGMLVNDLQAIGETYERHCSFYATFLVRQDERLKGREHADGIGMIETEIENIRNAWQWAVTHRHIDELDQCLQSLSIFYITKCWYQEGATLFAQAAKSLHMEHPSGKQGILLGKVLTKQGWMMESLGQMPGTYPGESAQALYLQSISILRALGAHSHTGEALNHLGHLLIHIGDFEQGLARNQEALTVYGQQHDYYGMARTLHDLGYTCLWIGRYQEAIEYLRQGIAICEERGDLRTLGDILNLLADTYIALEHYEEAQHVVEASLEARRTSGDKRGMAWSLNTLGALAWYQGDFTTAKQQAEAGLALFQEVGLTRTQDASLNVLGNIACSLGDYQQARSYFSTILASHPNAGTINNSWLAAETLVGLATLLSKEGKTAHAAELLILVQQHPTAWHETRIKAARRLAELAIDVPEDPRPLDVVVAELLNQTCRC